MKKLTTIFFLFLLLGSCKQSDQETASGDYYYTCSMHPQIVEHHPGLCPICHMDLIRVKRTQSAPDEITLNEEQIRLGNIIVDTLSFSEMGNRQILTATVTADESRTEVIPVRVSGRIDRLYYKTEGEYVSKGQPVYALYSEALNSAKQELIVLAEKKKTLDNGIINFDQLIQAARQKLSLLGMSNNQIDELLRTGKSPLLTTVYSPVSGYVIELPFAEGDYVAEGNTVMRIADFSKLWVETQVYASQVSSIQDGTPVTIEFPDLPGQHFSGKVSFVAPELMSDERIALARIEIPNIRGKLRPGMAAYVISKPDTREVLTLPVDAVIRDGTKNIVWLQKDSATFRYREVETGAESNHRIAITAGLDEGDKVVMSGTYLLNSEYLLKKGSGE